MVKEKFHVICSRCDKRSTTTIEENRVGYICTKCKKEVDGILKAKDYQPKPSFFKRATDWLIDKFGD